jgi:hypothetical protein
MESIHVEPWQAYLPVLGVAEKHGWVLRLADFASIIILNLLHILLGLDAVILREGALVTSTAGMGEEVWADRLDAAISSARDRADSLEVLVRSPSGWKDWERERNLCNTHIGVDWLFSQIVSLTR